jgi:hypothetical protein
VTRVAIIQSNYIPWKGYFDIIHDVERFVFYDDVQYTIRDWRNRNRIKTTQGLRWLTVPVGADRDRLICDVRIVDDAWAKTHWETIKQAYAKAPYFRQYRGFFEHIYLAMAWSHLSELNQFLIKHISREFLGIQVEFRDSREFDVTGHKLDRLVNLLQTAGATSYVSGPAAKAYIDPEIFRAAGIRLAFKDYNGYPEYPQPHPPFEHSVSILDLLFCCGPAAPEFIWGWRQARSAALQAVENQEPS